MSLLDKLTMTYCSDVIEIIGYNYPPPNSLTTLIIIITISSSSLVNIVG